MTDLMRRMKKSSLLKNEKGQILTEALIALMALGTGLVALLYGLSNAVWAVNTVANSRTAMNLARAQMEYIQAQSFDGDSNIHYLKLLQGSLPADSSPDDIDISVVQESDYLQLITVTVSYVDREAVVEDYKPNHLPLGYAIFANDTGGDDETVNIQGSNWRIQGDVLSKSGVTLAEDAGNKVNGDISYQTGHDFDGSEDDVWGNVFEDEATSGISPPVDYQSYSDFGYPTFWLEDGDDGNNDNMVDLNLVDEVWVDPTQKTQLKSGVYYYEGVESFDIESIKLSCSDNEDMTTISGRVTFIAEGIEIQASDNPLAEGNRLILSPWRNGVLALAIPATQQERIKISANHSIISGTLYAPEGKVAIGESGTPVEDDVFAGIVIAKEVEVYGQDSSIGF